MQAGTSETTADVVIRSLIAWNVRVVFGIVGDGVNPLIEALREHADQIRYIGVRHEEAAAFMASAWSKYTGQLGVCIGTTGPGAVHLMNGLYDAHMDGASVLALTGTTFHDLSDTRFQQDIDTVQLMRSVALYNVAVSGPRHAAIVTNLACRAALGQRGVAHLAIAKDTQQELLEHDTPSMENHGLKTSAVWTSPAGPAAGDAIEAAANLLNSSARIAILAGQGALLARQEVLRLAELLGAPVAKSLLAKTLLDDDSPYTTGGIGHLGTLASQQMMKSCDTLLILGSTMPWIDYYPDQGKARGIQVDVKPERIGLRYPVEIGLVGDVRDTLRALLPRLRAKTDRTWLALNQTRMADWNRLIEHVEQDARVPIRPQGVVRTFGDLLDADAIISLDCGANTHFAARHLRVKATQQLALSGMLASMGPGLPFSIAAKLAFPDRQSVAVVGDGGFGMLMAEFSTAVRLKLPIKVLLLKNNVLGEVQFEQRDLGFPTFGCELGTIDFAQFAVACGGEGYRCTRRDQLASTFRQALASPGAAIIEVSVDPEEPPLTPQKFRAANPV